MVAAARLGARCGMIGVVDGGTYGKFCLDDFKDHGIDVSRMIIDEDGRPFSIVLADDETHGRSIIYYREPIDHWRSVIWTRIIYSLPVTFTWPPIRRWQNKPLSGQGRRVGR